MQRCEARFYFVEQEGCDWDEHYGTINQHSLSRALVKVPKPFKKGQGNWQIFQCPNGRDCSEICRALGCE